MTVESLYVSKKCTIQIKVSNEFMIVFIYKIWQILENILKCKVLMKGVNERC